MEILGYTSYGAIAATIDGIRMVIPDDPTNRHRQMIADWEAEGNTIPAYVAPPPVPPTPEEILRQAMFEDFVERAVKNTTTPKVVKDAAIAYKAGK